MSDELKSTQFGVMQNKEARKEDEAQMRQDEDQIRLHRKQIRKLHREIKSLRAQITQMAEAMVVTNKLITQLAQRP